MTLVQKSRQAITFTNDLVSRAIKCRLDCGQERAQDRKFKCDILAHAKARRGELVAAALTVLRAYVVAGRPLPSDVTPSRFPDWDRLVRGALLWLGDGPLRNCYPSGCVDPEREGRLTWPSPSASVQRRSVQRKSPSALAVNRTCWCRATGGDRPVQ